MSVLTRYILREILLPLFATIALVIIGAATTQLIRLANEVSALGMSLGDLMFALPYAMPTFLGMGLPVAYFLSLLIGFGRLNDDRELTALAASGMSTKRLLALPLSLGVVMAIIGSVMTLWAEPTAIKRLRDILVESAADYFGRSMAPGVIHDHLGALTIYFGGREADTGDVYQVFIADERDVERPRLMIARSGHLGKGEGTHLVFALEHGELHEGLAHSDSYRRITFDELRLEIDTEVFVGQAVNKMPRFNSLSVQALLNTIETGAPDERDFSRITLHRKIAFPLANIIFVLIAFATVTWFTRLKAYMISASLVAVYFTMAQGTESLMQRFALGAVAATWAPSVLFFVIGASMTAWRLRR